ncbi:MAG: sugar phosphate isomerase/epimerase family protein [Oscillospiraceae bacterium]
MASALRAVRQAGYASVESYKLPPTTENAKSIKQSGISHGSAQTAYWQLENNFAAHAAFYNETGCSTAVIAIPPLSVVLGNLQKWREFAGQVNRLAARYADRGIRLCYHHHQFEFCRVEGVRPMDLLLERLDGSVGFICDTYRLQQGGVSPQVFLQQLSGRVAGIHLRDYAVRRGPLGFAPVDCAVGEGNLDIPLIVRAAKEAGACYAAVEQGTKQPWENAKRSLQYINAMIEKDKGENGGTTG